jgi:anti-sigma regulatory factor (Ser/Thr protein kinase)
MTLLEATKRPINLSFKYTACVDAVSFELLKNAIIHYYQHIIQNGDIKVKIDNDRMKATYCVVYGDRVGGDVVDGYTYNHGYH